MNSLSWTILLADVARKFNDSVGLLCVIAAFAGGAAIIVGFVCKSSRIDTEREAGIVMHVWAKRLLPIVGFLVLISMFVPSQKAIMMVAASEFGEKVYNSDKTQKIINPAVDALSEYLQDFVDEARSNREKRTKK